VDAAPPVRSAKGQWGRVRRRRARRRDAPRGTAARSPAVRERPVRTFFRAWSSGGGLSMGPEPELPVRNRLTSEHGARGEKDGDFSFTDENSSIVGTACRRCSSRRSDARRGVCPRSAVSRVDSGYDRPSVIRTSCARSAVSVEATLRWHSRCNGDWSDTDHPIQKEPQPLSDP